MLFDVLDQGLASAEKDNISERLCTMVLPGLKWFRIAQDRTACRQLIAPVRT